MAPVFIPAFAGMILTADTLAAALLFNLYCTDGVPFFLAGGAGYLINALLIVPWALMFPGVIDIPHAAWDQQSSPWLLLAWHFTFPIVVALGASYPHASVEPSRRSRTAALVIVAAFVVAILLLLTVSLGRGRLPVVVHGALFLPDWAALTVVAAIINFVGCGLVLRSRPLSGAHIWLTVALATAGLDMCLNTLAPARFSVPWYAGKLQTMVSASSVLIALLAAWSGLRERAVLLAEQLALFDSLVESAPSAMVLADELGRITLVNSRAERLFGYCQDELLDQSIELLLPDRFRHHHPAFRRAFNEARAAREMGVGRELHGRRKDGSEVAIEIGLNPIKTAGKLFTLAAITDITERKAVEELRRFKADAQLAAAQHEAEPRAAVVDRVPACGPSGRHARRHRLQLRRDV